MPKTFFCMSYSARMVVKTGHEHVDRGGDAHRVGVFAFKACPAPAPRGMGSGRRSIQRACRPPRPSAKTAISPLIQASARGRTSFHNLRRGRRTPGRTPPPARARPSALFVKRQVFAVLKGREGQIPVVQQVFLLRHWRLASSFATAASIHLGRVRRFGVSVVTEMSRVKRTLSASSAPRYRQVVEEIITSTIVDKMQIDARPAPFRFIL